MGSEPNDIACREATTDDFDEIAAVWWESGRTADGAPAEHPSIEDLRTRIEAEVRADWALSIALRHGRIVGLLAIKRPDAILDQLFVLPSAQGSGVGRTLFERAKAAMPGGFTLRTAQGNARARRFYEAAGMSLSAEGLHPRYGSPVCYYRWDG